MVRTLLYCLWNGRWRRLGHRTQYICFRLWRRIDMIVIWYITTVVIVGILAGRVCAGTWPVALGGNNFSFRRSLPGSKPTSDPNPIVFCFELGSKVTKSRLK